MSKDSKRIRDVWRGYTDDYSYEVNAYARKMRVLWENALDETKSVLRDRRERRAEAMKERISRSVEKFKGYSNVLNLKNWFDKKQQTAKAGATGTKQFALSAEEKQKLSKLFASNEVMMDAKDVSNLRGEISPDGSEHKLTTFDGDVPRTDGKDYAFSFLEEDGTYSSHASEYTNGRLVENKPLATNNMYARMAYGLGYDEMAENSHVHDDMTLKDFLDTKERVQRRGKPSVVVSEKELLVGFAESNGYEVVDESLTRVSVTDEGYRFGFKTQDGEDVMMAVDRESGDTYATAYDGTEIKNEQIIETDKFFARGVLGDGFDSIDGTERFAETGVDMSLARFIKAQADFTESKDSKVTGHYGVDLPPDVSQRIRVMLKDNGWDDGAGVQDNTVVATDNAVHGSQHANTYDIQVPITSRKALAETGVQENMRLFVDGNTGKTNVFKERLIIGSTFDDPDFAFTGKERKARSKYGNMRLSDLMDSEGVRHGEHGFTEKGAEALEHMLRARGFDDEIRSLGVDSSNGNPVIFVNTGGDVDNQHTGVRLFVDRESGVTRVIETEELAQGMDLSVGLNAEQDVAKESKVEIVDSVVDSTPAEPTQSENEAILQEINRVLHDPDIDSATALARVQALTEHVEPTTDHEQRAEQIESVEPVNESAIESDFTYDAEFLAELESEAAELGSQDLQDEQKGDALYFDNTDAYKEHTYRNENNMKRLFVAHEQRLADDEHGNPRYALAISHANDIGIHNVTDDPMDETYHVYRVKEYHENPMLVNQNVKDNPNQKHHFAVYTQSEYDKIKENSNNGAFLARTQALRTRNGEVVDIATVEASQVPFDHKKHIANTKAYRRALEVAEQTQSQGVTHEAEREEELAF